MSAAAAAQVKLLEKRFKLVMTIFSQANTKHDSIPETFLDPPPSPYHLDLPKDNLILPQITYQVDH